MDFFFCIAREILIGASVQTDHKRDEFLGTVAGILVMSTIATPQLIITNQINVATTDRQNWNFRAKPDTFS